MVDALDSKSSLERGGGSSPLSGTNMNKNVKLIIYVPISHTEIVRQKLGELGAGQIGNYTFCSFTTHGTGRFKGNDSSNPTIGQKNNYESVDEEKIEVTVPVSAIKNIITEIKSVHPYEEMAYDVYPLISIDEL